MLAAGLTVACSATPLPPSFAEAQALERAGRHEAALQAYRRAMRECLDEQACTAAQQRVAETLERLGRHREAVRAYLQLTRERGAGRARGLHRAGRLLERHLRASARAETLYRRAVVECPNEVAAEDALRDWTALRRRQGGDRAALSTLLDLFPLVRYSGVADKLLFMAGEIYERHGRLDEALSLYDRLLVEQAKSALTDDTLWASARLLERRGAHRAALARYRRLLRGRRYPLVLATGSYNSIYMDRAQLRIATILRERLHDERSALEALRVLRDDFRDSLLRDDAQLYIARIHYAAGRAAKACAALTLLARRFPDGNRLRAARQARAAWRCATPSLPAR